MKSQNVKIVERLKKYGYISNFWAIEKKVSYRLAPRISELRRAGWKIKTERKKNKDTFYVLEGGKI